MCELFKIVVALTSYLTIVSTEGYRRKSPGTEYLNFYKHLQQIKDFNGLVLKSDNTSTYAPNVILLIERNGNGFSVTKRTEEEKPEGPVHNISREYFKKLYMILENALKTLHEEENDEESDEISGIDQESEIKYGHKANRERNAKKMKENEKGNN